MSDALTKLFGEIVLPVTDDAVLVAINRETSLDATLQVCRILNLHTGPKNKLLFALMDTLQDETQKKDLPYGISFAREYRNRTILQLVEQHAEAGFNFNELKQAVLKATGQQTRVMHVEWARQNVVERWSDEYMAAHEQRMRTLTPAYE